MYSAVIFVMDAESENEKKRIRDAIQMIETIQSMIDVSADRLEGLRTQCSTSAELTQQEIRTLEVGGRGRCFTLRVVVTRCALERFVRPELQGLGSQGSLRLFHCRCRKCERAHTLLP